MTKLVFTAETKRFFGNRKLVIAVVLFIVVAFACIAAATMIEFGIEKKEPMQGAFFEEQIRQELEMNEKFLREDSGMMDKQMRTNLEITCARLRFYLENGTTLYDYAQSDAYNTRDAGRSYMTRYFLFGSVIAVMTALAGALFFFGQEYSGRFRLCVFQGIPRKAIFFGKTTFSLSCTAAVCITVMLIGLICAAFSPESNAITVDWFGMKVYSESIWATYGTYCITLIVMCAAVFGLTVFLSAITKKAPLTIAIIAAVLVIFAIFGVTIKTVGVREMAFFPFYGLVMLAKMGMTPALGVLLSVYAVLAAAFYFGGYAIFTKQEL